MKRKPGVYVLIAIILLMFYVLLESATFERIGAKLGPMVIAGAVFILALVELVREARGGKVGRVTMEIGAGTPQQPPRRYLLEGAWIAGFYVAIYLVGFLMSVPLFVFSYLKCHGRRWSTAVMIAALMTILSYGLFAYVLQVRFYPGLIFEWFGLG